MKINIGSKLRRICLYLAFIFVIVLFTGIASAEIPGKGFSPTTGLPSDKPYRPILVSISNDEFARPGLNLTEADIIYEHIIWGPGHTRYLALYNDQHPEMVGYTRGSRIFDMSLSQAWDCLIVHRGGQTIPGTSIVEYIQKNGMPPAFSVTSSWLPSIRARDAFFRDSKERISPHNKMVLLASVLEHAWPKADDGMAPYMPRLPGIWFSQTPSIGTEAADSIIVQYTSENISEDERAYIPMFAYDKDTKLYKRFYNSQSLLDEGTDTQIAVSNIIVQKVPLVYYENEMMRPVMEGIGGGPIDAFINGTRIKGVWRRDTLRDPYTYLDLEGYPLVLFPGKTFIQIIPESIRLDEKESKGGTFVYKVQP